MNIKQAQSLVDVLERHAAERPEALAYVFLDGKGGQQASLTFSQLWRRVRAIAARLQQAGASGQAAALVYQPGLEFIESILACFAAKVLAVPVQPLRNAREAPRVVKIMEDARCGFLLTNAPTLATMRRAQQEVEAGLTGVRWLGTDEVPHTEADSFRREAIEPSSLAFLQYTSGSTGSPKGVMVSHSNLMHNEHILQMAFGHNETTRFVGWLPLYHDMGLIGVVFQSLYLGVPAVLLAPLTFLTSPVTWLQAISRWKATTSGAPSFAYELCVQRATAENMEGVDLSSWSLAFNGAEPVKAQVINAFIEKFAPHGFREEAFYPCYGMAEATLFVTGGSPTAKVVQLPVDAQHLMRNTVVHQEGPSTVLVGCGKTHGEHVVRVVDPESLRVLADGQIGELWISGPSVAGGYWNKPELTRATFQARTSEGEGPFLRTGDLGFWHEGELFISGRLKDLIIIRGRNYYPDDIESTVYNSHPAFRPTGAAAFTMEVEGVTQLVVVAEVQRTFLSQLDARTSKTLLLKARQDVAEVYGLQLAELVLIKPATLPKTTSGKVRRSYCRELYRSGGLERVEPGTVATAVESA